MVYTRKWKNKQKTQLPQLSENLSDFIIDGNANVFVVGTEALLESQAGGLYINADRSVDVELSAF